MESIVKMTENNKPNKRENRETTTETQVHVEQYQIIRGPERKETGAEKVFEEMAKTLPCWAKDTNPQIQEAEQTSKSLNKTILQE